MKHKDKVENLQKELSLELFLNEFRESRLVLGMRLHYLILAAGSGVPMVAFEYMPKVSNFMDEIDCKEFSLAISNDISSELIIDKCKKIFGQHQFLSNKLIQNSRNLSQVGLKELENFFEL